MQVMNDKVLRWKAGDAAPTDMKSLRDVQKMACARDGHCIAVTHAGQVLQWKGEEAPRRLKAMENQKIASISGGGKHLALLTEAGDLYTIGANEYGQLGAGDHVPRPDEPVKVAQQVLATIFALCVCESRSHTVAVIVTT